MSFLKPLRVLFCSLLCLGILAPAEAVAAAGEYRLRVKGGPSISLSDWENQARVGGEFDYDFGYQMGFNLLGVFGVSRTFRFDLIPGFRYDYLHIGPANLYGVVGAGFTVLGTESALSLRFGTGLVLPLGKNFEFNTDVNFLISPAGVPGTPVTVDWLIGFGFRFG